MQLLFIHEMNILRRNNNSCPTQFYDIHDFKSLHFVQNTLYEAKEFGISF